MTSPSPPPSPVELCDESSITTDWLETVLQSYYNSIRIPADGQQNNPLSPDAYGCGFRRAPLRCRTWTRRFDWPIGVGGRDVTGGAGDVITG